MLSFRAKVAVKRATDSFKKSWFRARKPIVQLFKTLPPPPTTSSARVEAFGVHPPVDASTSTEELVGVSLPVDASTEEIVRGVSSPVEEEELIYAFGILGTVGPLDNRKSGWMATDFGAWMFLISHMNGYHHDRTVWRTIRPINDLFPGDFVVFGDAGCDRLQLPLPALETNVQDPDIPAHLFAAQCLLSLQKMAQKVKCHEKLLLLLIGHGTNYDNVFRLVITAGTKQITGEAFLTKDQLEAALEDCQGDILVICNSCHSGNLASERWTLLCSAGPDQASDALSESLSGRFKGSVFTACVVAQAAREHGLRVPLPQAEPRPVEGDQAPMPPSPPPHSFSTPATGQVTIPQPLNTSFEEFMGRVENMQRFLVEHSPSIFEVKGSKSTVSWNKVLPINFTAEAVGRISVKATSESADYSSIHNVIFFNSSPGDLQGGPFPTPQSPRLNTLLEKFLAAEPDIRPVPFNHDAILARTIADLQVQWRIAESKRYAFVPQAGEIGTEDLLFLLRSVHVQALAVQLIAREMGWYNAAKVTPFLPHQINGWNFQEMIQKGLRVDNLAGYLHSYHSHGYPYVQHCAILQSVID